LSANPWSMVLDIPIDIHVLSATALF